MVSEDTKFDSKKLRNNLAEHKELLLKIHNFLLFRPFVT